MSKLIDLSGQKFNRLTVLKRFGTDKKKNAVWICRCNCGNLTNVISVRIKNGHTKSCGCLRKKHGMKNTVEYEAWLNMKKRCSYKCCKLYKNYGGRGITVCKRWSKFENFYKDMGRRPKGLSLDRINNNGNYCKENCRWATPKEQARNRRSNKMITYNGETKSMVEWSEVLDISYSTLKMRLNTYKWEIEKALTKK